MIKNSISQLFLNGGCLLDGEKKLLYDCDRDIVLKYFEYYGVIIFRNFKHEVKNIINFTDIFTKLYANDALRRNSRLENKKIKDVDVGNHKVDLHSEASFSPSWPEIIWFSCINPSNTNSGNTILCDGIKLWESLNFESKNFFLGNQIKYELKIPFGKPQNGKGYKDWYLDEPGVENCKLNLNEGLIEFDFNRYAVVKSRINNKLAFANHLIVTLESEDQLFSRKTAKLKDIPESVMHDVYKKSKMLTYSFQWQKNDVLMLDNRRFMHGREKISNGDKRDIINIQSLKTNFGFGHYIKN